MSKLKDITPGQLADALESGEFIKGKAALHHKNKNCCLGVLCHLADNVTKVGGGYDSFPDSEFVVGSNLVMQISIHEEVMNTSINDEGMDIQNSDAPDWLTPEVEETLMGWNDKFDDWKWVIVYLRSLESGLPLADEVNEQISDELYEGTNQWPPKSVS